MGQKQRGRFYRGSFRKGVRVPIGVLGGGVWGRVQEMLSCGLSVENEGTCEGGGRGGGVGWGQAKELASQCASSLSKLPFSKLPFSSPDGERGWWSSPRGAAAGCAASGGADFPAANLLAGKCVNLGRASCFVLPGNRGRISSGVRICRTILPARNFGQPRPSRVFWHLEAPKGHPSKGHRKRSKILVNF